MTSRGGSRRRPWTQTQARRRRPSRSSPPSRRPGQSLCPSLPTASLTQPLLTVLKLSLVHASDYLLFMFVK